MKGQADFFDGVYFNRATGRIEKYRDGVLVTYFRAGLRPSLAKRLGMDADPETYPDIPTSPAAAHSGVTPCTP